MSKKNTHSGPRICVKYFLSFPQKKAVTRVITRLLGTKLYNRRASKYRTGNLDWYGPIFGTFRLGSITHEEGLVHHAHFKTWRKHYNLAMCKMTHSVPKVIFLQTAEFYSVRSKNYENGHKNIFGLSIVLELKVETAKFWLSRSFSYVKNRLNPSQLFFIEEYKKGEQLLLLSYFDNFDF